MSLVAALRGFLQRHPYGVVFAEEGATLVLYELASGKELRLAASALATVEPARNELAGHDYLRVTLHDGRSFALAPPGIVFRPDLVNSGPLPDAPTATCLADYRRLAGMLEELLGSGDADGRKHEALDVVVLCIAILDGARALGLEVSREERWLEGLLSRVEAL